MFFQPKDPSTNVNGSSMEVGGDILRWKEGYLEDGWISPPPSV